MRFRQKYFINDSVEKVYNKFLDIKKWSDLFPHIKKVKIINENEKEQHFVMTIQNPKKIEEIETIRTFKKNDYIAFNQPRPPRPMKVHKGKWKFIPANNGTMVESIHEIKTGIPLIGFLVSIFIWVSFIKKSGLLALRSVKLNSEFNKLPMTKIIKRSCFVQHSIDIDLCISEAFDIIGNPKLWPFMFPTAINVNVLKHKSDLIEFELSEYVGKKVFYSRIHFHLDRKNFCIYYQHYPPRYPVKYMIVRWIFRELGPRKTKFTIFREYDISIPVFGRIFANTVAKWVIKSHVNDYHNDLRQFVKILNVLDWAKNREE